MGATRRPHRDPSGGCRRVRRPDDVRSALVRSPRRHPCAPGDRTSLGGAFQRSVGRQSICDAAAAIDLAPDGSGRGARGRRGRVRDRRNRRSGDGEIPGRMAEEGLDRAARVREPIGRRAAATGSREAAATRLRRTVLSWSAHPRRAAARACRLAPARVGGGHARTAVRGTSRRGVRARRGRARHRVAGAVPRSRVAGRGRTRCRRCRRVAGRRCAKRRPERLSAKQADRLSAVSQTDSRPDSRDRCVGPLVTPPRMSRGAAR